MDKVALYVRVSTSEQTTDNQTRILSEVAKAKGWQIAFIYEDKGVSGTKGRDKRPAFDKLCNDMTIGAFERVLVWDISRLGRSLKNLVEFLHDLQRSCCDLYVHQSGLDTSTPAGKMMFQMVGVFSEFERSMISERVKLGMQRVRSEGKRVGRPPKITLETIQEVFQLKQSNLTNTQIASTLHISKMTVSRILESKKTAVTTANHKNCQIK